ncbi:MAG TPA: hypothetical protein VLW17_05630 [Thermoanaerobaculaceae bacterium]|nr:hypothetical protein [Thermoanaerobaculaceae bacterium]
MSEALAIVAALLCGAAITARRGAPGSGASAVVAVVAAGTLATAVWLGLLQLAGLRWSRALVLAPAAASAVILLVAALRPPRGAGRAALPRSERRWAAAAGTAALAAAVPVALTPAFGWDFRYIWGLKARVFAAAGAHDAAWLAWPGHAFAHPDYPPLWPDLVASGAVLGADPARCAALWQAVLVLALAAACWQIARGAPGAVRALAAAAGAWTPVLAAPLDSGYAEALLAFLAAAALAALLRWRGGEAGAMAGFVVAAAALALAKNEGLALAAGFVFAAVLVARGRSRIVPALALLPAAAWQVFLLAGGIRGEGIVLSPAFLAARTAAAPAALAHACRDPLVLGELLAWALALLALRGARLGPIPWVAATWATAVVVVYLAGPADMPWRMANSLDRVLGAPLPAAIALALGACSWRGADAGVGPAAAERGAAGPARPA